MSYKNWPCGTFRTYKSMVVLCDVDGDGKDMDDFRRGDYCKIKTTQTTHDGYEFLYSADSGKYNLLLMIACFHGYKLFLHLLYCYYIVLRFTDRMDLL